MHRLSSIAKHTRSSPRIINLSVINTQRDQAHRRRSLGPKRKWDCPNPRTFNRNYKNHHAGLVSHVFLKNYSSYNIHPEKLMQIMKEKDGQSLCQYFDSDTYKMKAVDLVEEQSRVIDELTPNNVKENIDVTYEHMLSCAQPRQKPKVFIVQDDKEEDVSKRPSFKNTLIKKLLRFKKNVEEDEPPVREEQVVEAHHPSRPKKVKCKKKYRKRTTILPLYLKKIHDNLAVKDKVSLHEISSVSKDESPNEDDAPSQIAIRPSLQITKSKYTISNEEKVRHARKILKEKVLYADYENEVNRSGPSLKYTVGNEEERHWYQNPNSPMKFDNGGL